MSVTEILPDLSHLGGLVSDVDPATTWTSYRQIIESAIADMPRTQQVRIGPSELGTDCNLCLARKLAGIQEARDVAWLPWVGTAVHAQLDDVFTRHNATLPALRFLTELTVSVGEVDGQEITGHLDNYDLATAEITDWKIVGKTTLTKVKAKGPTPAYRTQGHLYGRGVVRRGLPVRRVRIAYLPRNEPTLDNAVIWSEPYDEQVALKALARADALAKALRVAGVEAVLAGLTGAAGCYSCARYPDADGKYPAKPGHNPDGDLRGLIPPAPAAAGNGPTAA